MAASQGEAGSLRAACAGVRCGGAIAVHIAIYVAVDVAVRMVTARRLRVVGETVVLVAFAALVLRMLMTAVRCAVTGVEAAAIVAAVETAAIAAAAETAAIAAIVEAAAIAATRAAARCRSR